MLSTENYQIEDSLELYDTCTFTSIKLNSKDLL